MDIRAFFEAVWGQDAGALLGFFSPEAVVRWHCSNECFTREEYIRANCEYPGDWAGELERVEELGDTLVTAARTYLRDGSLSFHVVSFFRLRAGKILELDEYWADDGQPPAWRQEMGIGRPIR